MEEIKTSPKKQYHLFNLKIILWINAILFWRTIYKCQLLPFPKNQLLQTDTTISTSKVFFTFSLKNRFLWNCKWQNKVSIHFKYLLYQRSTWEIWFSFHLLRIVKHYNFIDSKIKLVISPEMFSNIFNKVWHSSTYKFSCWKYNFAYCRL